LQRLSAYYVDRQMDENHVSTCLILLLFCANIDCVILASFNGQKELAISVLVLKLSVYETIILKDFQKFTKYLVIVEKPASCVVKHVTCRFCCCTDQCM